VSEQPQQPEQPKVLQDISDEWKHRDKEPEEHDPVIGPPSGEGDPNTLGEEPDKPAVAADPAPKAARKPAPKAADKA
jgi:hypothetical protein